MRNLKLSHCSKSIGNHFNIIFNNSLLEAFNYYFSILQPINQAILMSFQKFIEIILVK